MLLESVSRNEVSFLHADVGSPVIRKQCGMWKLVFSHFPCPSTDQMSKEGMLCPRAELRQGVSSVLKK